jgi:hypothetical protein
VVVRLIEKIKSCGITTAWEQNYKLCYEFKRAYKQAAKEVKLLKLKELAGVVLDFEQKTSYEIRRKKKHPTRKACWVCRGRAFCQHHIILIKSGGFDSGINRIPICSSCHKQIHWWMV